MLSHGLVDNIIPIVAVLGIGGFFLMRFIKSEEGKMLMDRAFFNAPIFGPILQKGGTARFSRTMSTLLSSGVNVLDALDICRSTVDNAVLEEAVAKVRPDVEQGKTLGGTFSKLKVFPLMATQMIMVGENTGQLDKMLEKVADFYEAEVEILVGGLTKLIEPIMLVFLGGVVGGIMIAMYLPIFKMADGVK
jgi:type IV pilus assembly protein PilC